MAFVVAQHAGAGMRFSSSDRGEAKEEAKEEEIKRRAVTKLWKEAAAKSNGRRGGSQEKGVEVREVRVDNGSSEHAAKVIQRCYFRWSTRKVRLHRKNLVERLALEDQVARGSMRLCNLMVISLLMLLSLQLATNTTSNNAIRLTLADAFDFDGIQEATSLPDLWEALRGVGDACDDFFPSSSSLYESGLGPVEFNKDVEDFTQTRVLADEALMNPDIPFTLQAWVKVSARFKGGPILRKRLSATADAALSCWGWFITPTKLQALHYGAHVDYPRSPSGISSPSDDLEQHREASVGAEQIEDPEVFHLYTMVVTSTEVAWYIDLQEVGRASLLYPVTDCYNPGGLEMGAPELSLGELRYYPFALQPAQLKEVFVHGDILGMMARGSRIAATQPPGWVDTGRADEASEQARKDEAHMRSIAHAVYTRERTPPPAVALVELPFGQLPVGASQDASGLSYFSVVDAPAVTTMHNSTSQQPRYFVIPGVASAETITLTLWYRHSLMEPYIVAAHETVDTDISWSFWAQTRGFAFWSSLTGDQQTIRYPLPLTAHNELRTDSWRHLAFQLDGNANELRIFLDGAFAASTPSTDLAAGKVRAMIDQTGVMAVGHSFPGFTYEAETFVADYRLYTTALDAAQVYTLAFEPSSLGTPGSGLCAPTVQLVDDGSWTDFLGNSCSWYSEHRSENPTICDLEEARAACLLTCGTNACFNAARPAIVRYVWDSIRSFSPKSVNGSICLSSRLSSDQVVAACRERAASGGYTGRENTYLGTFDAYQGGPTGANIDVTDCDALEASIDETCAFDGDTTQQFADDVRANGGDYSIYFWVKPTENKDALDLNGQFQPHLGFYQSLSPAFASVHLGATHSADLINTVADAYFFSTCADGAAYVHAYQLAGGLSQDSWTLVMLVRSNTTSPTSVKYGAGLDRVGDPGVGENPWPQCLYDPTAALFNAIELNQGMHISPIALVPWAMSHNEQQLLFNAEKGTMKHRSGPSSTAQGRANKVHPVEKASFLRPMALVAPPMIFQKRVQAVERCGFTYSDRWVRQQHEASIATQCAGSRVCEEDLMARPLHFFECEGSETVDDGVYYGLPVIKFQGQSGFADFLFSFTRRAFITRDGEALATDEFLDQRSQQVQAVFVFYSPNVGTTSVMQVMADTAGPRVSTKVALEHYVIVEGSRKDRYLAIQALNLVFVLMLVLDNLHLVVRAWRRHRAAHKVAMTELFLLMYDFGVGSLTTTVTLMRIPTVLQSGEQTATIMGQVSSIAWSDVTVDNALKVEQFLTNCQQLLSMMGKQTMLNTLCGYILVALVIRVILATEVHPRLAVLTGTLSRAADDIWHTTLLVGVTQLFFAALASWQFGATRDEFSTFGTTMSTQLLIMFGIDLPENWTESYDIACYTLIFLAIMHVLVLNFVLALIVEAYLKVREYNEELEVENEFLTDVWQSIAAKWKWYALGWGSPDEFMEGLQTLFGKGGVDFDDLCRVGGFRSHRSARSFMQHYSRYEFMEAPTVERPAHHSAVMETTESIALLLGKPVPKRSEQYHQMLVSKRNKDSLNHQYGSVETEPSGLAFLDNEYAPAGQGNDPIGPAPRDAACGDALPMGARRVLLEVSRATTQLSRRVEERMSQSVEVMEDRLAQVMEDVLYDVLTGSRQEPSGDWTIHEGFHLHDPNTRL